MDRSSPTSAGGRIWPTHGPRGTADGLRNRSLSREKPVTHASVTGSDLRRCVAGVGFEPTQAEPTVLQYSSACISKCPLTCVNTTGYGSPQRRCPLDVRARGLPAAGSHRQPRTLSAQHADQHKPVGMSLARLRPYAARAARQHTESPHGTMPATTASSQLHQRLAPVAATCSPAGWHWRRWSPWRCWARRRRAASWKRYEGGPAAAPGHAVPWCRVKPADNGPSSLRLRLSRLAAERDFQRLLFTALEGGRPGARRGAARSS